MFGKSNETKLEETFLRIFKIVILIAMTLALLLVVIMPVFSTILYLQKPDQVQPVREPPKLEIDLSDFKKSLKKDAADEKSEQKNATTSKPTTLPPTRLFNQLANALYQCSTDFARATSATLEETDNGSASQTAEKLRAEIERLSEDPSRGEPWANSLQVFVCAALRDVDIISDRKAGKISGVFAAAINFHIRAWDFAVAQREKFLSDENARFQSETLAANARAEQLHVVAGYMMLAAAYAFGVFMFLALYLLGAKIETNLRELSKTMRLAVLPANREPPVQ